MATTINYNELEMAICNADKAARAITNTEDGGTCNFDTPVIHLPKADRHELAGFDWRVEPVGEKGWKDCYFVFVTLHGQANRRTRMAEVAAASLKAAGYTASVYYQMD